LLYIGVFAAVLTALQTVYNGASLASKRGVKLTTAFSQLIPLSIFWVASCVWCFTSPSMYEQYPSTFLVTLNLVFSYLVINCIIQRICDLTYQYFYFPLLPLIVASIHSALKLNWTSQENVLFALCGLYLLMFIHFVVSIATGLCSQLKIRFWTIPYPNKGTKKS